jgi:hypothetical protein
MCSISAHCVFLLMFVKIPFLCFVGAHWCFLLCSINVHWHPCYALLVLVNIPFL